MLTDYYALLQPTKVNTGASFNLLQSRSFPPLGPAQVSRTAQAKVLLPARHLPVLEPVLSLETGHSPRQAVWKVARAKAQETTQGGDGEEGWEHAVLPPAPRLLPSSLFTLRPSDPQASAQQAPQRSASPLLGPSSPGRPGSAHGGPPTCFSQLGPGRTRQDSR